MAKNIAGWCLVRDEKAHKAYVKRHRVTYPGAPKHYPCFVKWVFDSGSDTTTDYIDEDTVNAMVASLRGWKL